MNIDGRSWRRILTCASFSFVLAIPALCGVAVPLATASSGDCGIPVTTGAEPKSSDCLFILRTGVGLGSCALCVCDTNGNGSISAGDALICLKVAVGQDVDLHCPSCSATTTTLVTTTTSEETNTTTTTIPTTTTTMLPSGRCPAVVEWTTRAAVGEACSTNSDCDAGTCSGGRCHTVTDIDIGWSGSGHNTDPGDGAVLRVLVDCEAADAPCGQCEVEGIEASAASCRCQNDSRLACDEPFALDADDCPACFGGAFVGAACTNNAECAAGTCSRRCANNLSAVCTKSADCPGSSCVTTTRCSNGKTCALDLDCTGTCTTGSLCQCYDGAPLPVSVAGTPFCLLPRLNADVTGTVNVDTGSSGIVKDVRTVVFSGNTTTAPCPICGGRCSGDGETLCLTDADCDGGDCELDAAPRDGVRGGVCIGGQAAEGLACDVHATNSSFPPGLAASAGYSLDCMPDAGKNNGTSGSSPTVESTGSQSLAALVSCGGANPELQCPCRVCSNNTALPCRSDADCSGGTCSASGGTGASQPNVCENHSCSATGDNEGACTTGPDDRFCDGAVKTDGRGLLACGNNADCAAQAVGFDAGSCSVVQRRLCFLDPIVATGHADAHRPVTAAASCWAALTTAGRSTAFGLPGPARVRRQTNLRSLCGNAAGQAYVPGSGGCP